MEQKDEVENTDNHTQKREWKWDTCSPYSPLVRKHLTGGFLCAVLHLSWILCPLLIPEYSGIKWSSKLLPGLRNACTAFLSFSIRWEVTIYDLLPFYEPYGKSNYLQPSLSYQWPHVSLTTCTFLFISAENSYLVRQYKHPHNVE